MKFGIAKTNKFQKDTTENQKDIKFLTTQSFELGF